MPIGSSERVVRSLPQPWEYTLGLNSGPVYWGYYVCVCVCVSLKVFCVNSWPYEDEGKDVTNKWSINLAGNWVPPFKIWMFWTRVMVIVLAQKLGQSLVQNQKKNQLYSCSYNSSLTLFSLQCFASEFWWFLPTVWECAYLGIWIYSNSKPPYNFCRRVWNSKPSPNGSGFKSAHLGFPLSLFQITQVALFLRAALGVKV